ALGHGDAEGVGKGQDLLGFDLLPGGLRRGTSGGGVVAAPVVEGLAVELVDGLLGVGPAARAQQRGADDGPGGGAHASIPRTKREATLAARFPGRSDMRLTPNRCRTATSWPRQHMKLQAKVTGSIDFCTQPRRTQRRNRSATSPMFPDTRLLKNIGAS